MFGDFLGIGSDKIILILASILACYMAANIGANDLANAMGTSVGSGALTIRQAVILSFFLELSGAVLAGGHVTDTIRKGLIDPALLSASPQLFLIGMFSALFAAGLWIHIATVFGLPVSTTHSIVGAVVGFGVLAVGLYKISWWMVAKIALSWVVSPLAGALIGGAVFHLVDKRILRSRLPYNAARGHAPFLLATVILVIVLSVSYKGLKNLNLHLGFWEALLLALPLALAGGFLGRSILSRLGGPDCRWIKGDEIEKVECVFGYLQIMTACYVAFAHGANDVANAVGPLAAIFTITQTGSVVMKVEVPSWMLAIGGGLVGIGLLIFGSRVVETIGKRITEITPVRGFCAEFGAATTVLICSRLGLPISTTHVLVGSVIGVGFMRGMGVLDLRVIKNIAYSWIVTLPFTIVLSMMIYRLIVAVLL
jgi:PiT family inorganic phosphate transporter